MRIDHVVVNASPLICLSKSGLLDFLPQLFAKIRIPEQVVGEIGVAVPVASIRAEIVPCVAVPASVAAWDLGAGESAVISACLGIKGCWAILDDREACRCADTVGCRHTGTIGVLLLAKKRGIVPAIRPLVDRLANAGLWMSDRFVVEVLRVAGE